MSSSTLSDRSQAIPLLEHALARDAAPPVAASPTQDRAAWERLLLAEDDLADAPPILLDMMRRESLYGD